MRLIKRRQYNEYLELSFSTEDEPLEKIDVSLTEDGITYTKSYSDVGKRLVIKVPCTQNKTSSRVLVELKYNGKTIFSYRTRIPHITSTRDDSIIINNDDLVPQKASTNEETLHANDTQDEQLSFAEDLTISAKEINEIANRMLGF